MLASVLYSRSARDRRLEVTVAAAVHMHSAQLGFEQETTDTPLAGAEPDALQAPPGLLQNRKQGFHSFFFSFYFFYAVNEA